MMSKVFAAWRICFATVLITSTIAPLEALAITYSEYRSRIGTVEMPVGNGNGAKPATNRHSVNRTRETGGSFEAKYQKVYNLLKNDRRLMRKIKSVARRYDIDPMHMVGAIVGEHTFNVDAYDRLQGYYIKAISYVNSNMSFSYDGIDIEEFVEGEQFEPCFDLRDSYYLWTCRENIWNTKFSGKTVNDVSYPKDRFSKIYFQPFFAGQTFGLGQINPLTALKMSDLVSKVSGFRKLDPGDAPEVYRAIMDPDRSLHFVAAILKQSIDNYRIVANFDISTNPGVTATLYNLGDAGSRARRLYNTNVSRLRRGQSLQYPKVNYYGWLVNEKEQELRDLLN